MKSSLMELEELSQNFEQSMSLDQLRYEERFLDQEAQSIARRKQIVHDRIQKNLPTLMDIQDRKRKAQCLEEEEFKSFVSLVGSNEEKKEIAEFEEEWNLPKTQNFRKKCSIIITDEDSIRIKF